ncbi:MAG: hypothetical protein PVF51_09095, partial [Nitrospirota bacterium]
MHRNSSFDQSPVGVFPAFQRTSRRRERKRASGWAALCIWMVAAAVVAGCATYGERVAPIPLPEAQADHVEVAGVKLVARPYVDKREAKE